MKKRLQWLDKLLFVVIISIHIKIKAMKSIIGFILVALMSAGVLLYPEVAHRNLFPMALVTSFFGFLSFICLRKMRRSQILYGIEFLLVDVLLFFHSALPLEGNLDIIWNWAGIHVCLIALTIWSNVYERRSEKSITPVK